MLKGSLGRGGGDERSDLDLVIVSEPGRRDELWAERGSIAAQLGRPLGLFRDIAIWEPPHLAIALYDGPLKVDLFFEDGEVEADVWLLDGFEVLLDRAEVGELLRRRLATLEPPRLDLLHDDSAELDSHAWDFALWLDRKLDVGERWLVFLELRKYVELIVLPAWNALAGEAWRGAVGLPKRVDPELLERLEVAQPRGTDQDELRRSLRALVSLYVEARPRLSAELGEPLSDELMDQVREGIG